MLIEYNCILIRQGEIFLKGKNRGKFENLLAKNIKEKLSRFDYKFKSSRNRFYIEDFDCSIINELNNELKSVFGIHSISNCIKIATSLEKIQETIKVIAPDKGTFRVTVKRADKEMPQTSIELAILFGSIICQEKPLLIVDLSNYEKEIYIDIRENGNTYIFIEKTLCLGGLPLGISGNGLLLLSGGIDSPVAGFLMAKRGLCLTGLHFHSFPFTGEQSLQKVKDLSKILSKYNHNFKLITVPFTEIQQEIRNNCPNSYLVTIMRRFMMRIAEILAEEFCCSSIITGESLGQVASQTIEGINCSQNVLKNTPVLRPLIGFDKLEIIKYSKKIGTYETSILPYIDCCTVFLPDNPIIHPLILDTIFAEKKLDIDKLVKTAISGIKIELF